MLLEMRNIAKSFPGVQALKQVSFSVQRGEVHALLGENGAGKSTLMKILAGVYQPENGEIFINGKKVSILNPYEARQHGIAIIYQELQLVPTLNAIENIFLGREIPKFRGWIDDKTARQKATELLADLQVEIDLERPVGELSVAQQQLIEIAKALSLNAQILIMDEPSAALMEKDLQILFRLVRRLKANGVGIVYISHRMREIFEIADQVSVLKDGSYMGTRKVSEVTQDDLIQMMIGRKIGHIYPEATGNFGAEVLKVNKLNRHGVLKDINIRVRAGEIVGIAGLVGSGRTELARALFGADPIDGGEIFLDGTIYKLRDPKQAIHCGIGFATEDRKCQGIFGNLSVLENISMANIRAYCRGGIIHRESELGEAIHFMKKLRIVAHRFEESVQNLSGGNQQKVVLAKWLATRSRLLILDEPTRGIDIGAKAEIYELMRELTRDGVGILMISSELPEVLGMSDRIYIMGQGRIAGELSRSEASEEAIMAMATGHFTADTSGKA